MIKITIWLVMMSLSIGFPTYAAIYIAWDLQHALLFESFSIPLICFAMAFYYT